MSACRWIYAGSFNEEEKKATILVEFSLTNQDMPHFLKSHEMSSQDFTQYLMTINPLSANPTKWSDTLKKFLSKFPTNCLSVFDHFVG